MTLLVTEFFVPYLLEFRNARQDEVKLLSAFFVKYNDLLSGS